MNCRNSENCGGGTRKLKLSECNKSTCCQIGNGWYFYPSIDECQKTQAARAPRYVAPTPWPTASLVVCQLSYGVYQLTSDKCNELKTKDQAIDQEAKEYGKYLNEEWDRQEAERKRQESIQSIQKCKNLAEQLANELCEDKKRAIPGSDDGSCGIIRNEQYRQQARCEQI